MMPFGLGVCQPLNGSYLLDSYIYWGDGTRSGFNASHRMGLPTQGAHSQAMADFNHDGKVNFVDFNMLAGYWMENCPANWPL
jgi:hypothetical protein